MSFNRRGVPPLSGIRPVQMCAIVSLTNQVHTKGRTVGKNEEECAFVLGQDGRWRGEQDNIG